MYQIQIQLRSTSIVLCPDHLPSRTWRTSPRQSTPLPPARRRHFRLALIKRSPRPTPSLPFPHRRALRHQIRPSPEALLSSVPRLCHRLSSRHRSGARLPRPPSSRRNRALKTRIVQAKLTRRSRWSRRMSPRLVRPYRPRCPQLQPNNRPPRQPSPPHRHLPRLHLPPPPPRNQPLTSLWRAGLRPLASGPPQPRVLPLSEMLSRPTVCRQICLFDPRRQIQRLTSFERKGGRSKRLASMQPVSPGRMRCRKDRPRRRQSRRSWTSSRESSTSVSRAESVLLLLDITH